MNFAQLILHALPPVHSPVLAPELYSWLRRGASAGTSLYSDGPSEVLILGYGFAKIELPRSPSLDLSRLFAGWF